MKASFRAVNPGEHVFEITIAMRLNEWKELASHVGAPGWPTSELLLIIQKCVNKATESFWSSSDSAE